MQTRCVWRVDGRFIHGTGMARVTVGIRDVSVGVPKIARLGVWAAQVSASRYV